MEHLNTEQVINKMNEVIGDNLFTDIPTHKQAIDLIMLLTGTKRNREYGILIINMILATRKPTLNKTGTLFNANPVTWAELLLSLLSYTEASASNNDLKRLMVVNITIKQYFAYYYSGTIYTLETLSTSEALVPYFVRKVSQILSIYKPNSTEKISKPCVTNLKQLALVFSPNVSLNYIFNDIFENSNKRTYDSWDELLGLFITGMETTDLGDKNNEANVRVVSTFLLFCTLITGKPFVPEVGKNMSLANIYNTWLYKTPVINVSDEKPVETEPAVTISVATSTKTSTKLRRGGAPWNTFCESKAKQFIASRYYDATINDLMDYIYEVLSFSGRTTITYNRIEDLTKHTFTHTGNLPIIAKSMLNALDNNGLDAYNLPLKTKLLENLRKALEFVIANADNVDKDELTQKPNPTNQENTMSQQSSSQTQQVEQRNQPQVPQYPAATLNLLNVSDIYTKAACLLNDPDLDLLCVNRDGISEINKTGNKALLIHSCRFYVANELIKNNGMASLGIADFSTYISLLRANYDSCSPLLIAGSYRENYAQLISDIKPIMESDHVAIMSMLFDKNNVLDFNLLVTLFMNPNLTSGFNNIKLLSESKQAEICQYQNRKQMDATANYQHTLDQNMMNTDQYTPTPAIDSSQLYNTTQPQSNVISTILPTNQVTELPSNNNSVYISPSTPAQQRLATLLGKSAEPAIDINEHLASLMQVIVENNQAIDAVSKSKNLLTQEYNSSIEAIDAKLNIYDNDLNEAITQFQELCDANSLDFTEVFIKLS